MKIDIVNKSVMSLNLNYLNVTEKAEYFVHLMMENPWDAEIITSIWL